MSVWTHYPEPPVDANRPVLFLEDMVRNMILPYPPEEIEAYEAYVRQYQDKIVYVSYEDAKALTDFTWFDTHRYDYTQGPSAKLLVNKEYFAAKGGNQIQGYRPYRDELSRLRSAFTNIREKKYPGKILVYNPLVTY